jgi:hypothetical protein
VASGQYAINIGNGTASSRGTIVIDAEGGASANSNNAIAIGTAAASTGGSASIAIGNNSQATGSSSMAIGTFSSSATAQNAVSIGREITASLRAQFETRPFSSVFWGGQTTDATANVELNLDAVATNRMVIAANTAVIADIFVIARRTDNTKFLSARRWVAIRRDGSNNTALIGAVQTMQTDQSEGSPTWTFTIDADDTASVESLRVRVTGAASETVNWRVCAIYRVVA